MTEIYPGIEQTPGKLGGKPNIRGMRIPVSMILEWLEAGESKQDIVDALEGITIEDVENCIRFARALVNGEIQYEMSA